MLWTRVWQTVAGIAVLAAFSIGGCGGGGGGGSSAFTDIAAGLAKAQGALAWGDYDNDGDLDLALSGYEVYRNNGGTFNTAPGAPAGLGATYTGTGPYDVTFTWDAATDIETPPEGLSYNLRVGTTTGGNEILSSAADLTTGWRRLASRGIVQPGLSVNDWTLTLPAGTYYWSVQAIDTGFEGSAWVTEQTVTVP